MAYLLKFVKVYNFKVINFSSFFHTSALRVHGSAGIIVIGDEILKGQVADTNSFFITRHLFELGIQVKKICVVGDKEDEIAEEIQNFSQNYSYVLTTGGIGPTHDDVTFSAVAKAFGEKLHIHPELQQICAKFFQVDAVDCPAMKLAHVPESAKLTYGYDKIKQRRTLYPNISVHNVYIFPGIPELMERLFLAVYKEQFAVGSSKVFTKEIYLNVTEVEIADELNAVVDEHPDVSIGSYPQLFNRYYKVHLTIQSSNKEELNKTYGNLVTTLPEGSLVDFDSKPTVNSYAKIMNLITEEKNLHVKRAMNFIQQCCEIYRPTEMCVLFDGSAESTVLLHLYHSYMRKSFEDLNLNVLSLVKEDNLELQQYILDTQKRYRINMTRLCSPQDYGLKAFMEYHKNYKMMFVGYTADSDSNMIDLFNKIQINYTTIQWINPLSSWTNNDIWKFLHSLYLPYSIICK